VEGVALQVHSQPAQEQAPSWKAQQKNGIASNSFNTSAMRAAQAQPPGQGLCSCAPEKLMYIFQGTAPSVSTFKCLFDSSQGLDLLLSRLTGAGAVLVGRIAWVGCIGPALGALLALGTGAGCALAGCWT